MSQNGWPILDLDEFLYCPNEVDIKKINTRIYMISQIHCRWVMHDSSDHIEQPKLVVPNFLMRKI